MVCEIVDISDILAETGNSLGEHYQINTNLSEHLLLFALGGGGAYQRVQQQIIKTYTLQVIFFKLS